MNKLETVLFYGTFASYGIFIILLLLEKIETHDRSKYWLTFCAVCFGALGTIGLVAGYLVAVFNGHVEPHPFL